MDKKLLIVLPHINFLLSILIVFHHSFTSPITCIGSFYPSIYGFTITIERYMYNLSECAVPVFFFLSAYLFYRTYDGSWGHYMYKMKRRFWSLLVPYIIFSTMGYLKVLVINSSKINGGVGGWLESLWLSNTMPLWFIRELIVMSLLAPIIYRVKKNSFAAILLSLILIVLSIMNFISYRSFLYWLPLYLMGAFLDANIIHRTFTWLSDAHNRLIAMVFFLGYLVWVWFLPNGLEKGDSLYSFEFIVFRLFTPIVFSVVIYVIYELHIKDRKWMHYSFFVYCMHAPVIALLGLLYDRVFIEFLDVELVKYIFIVIFANTFCVLVAMFLERYIPWGWIILNGKR